MVRALIGCSMAIALVAALTTLAAQQRACLRWMSSGLKPRDHRDEATLKRILDEGFIQTETGEDSKTVDKATYIRQVMSGSA